jgi:Calcineurin-like phosphoesterase/Purple acid Phosphatase, N-terminal domain
MWMSNKSKDFGGLVMVLGMLVAAAAAKAVTVTRGPYLQLGTPTSITVRWRTDSTNVSRVIYGASLSALNFTNTDSVPTTEHEVRLTGLSPDTRYYYAIGDAATVLMGNDTNTFFVTAPLPGTAHPTRIWAIGDSGEANGNQAAVRDAYYQFTGTNHTHLWLMLGDNAYYSGTDSEYQRQLFDSFGSLLRKSVLWPTLGNHDTAFSTEFTTNYPYFSMFTLPANGEAGGVASGTEHYYSFDYGNIHFVCLDSMTADRSPNGAMANWLRTDLAANTNAWLIAFWHHPPYSKGSHNSDAEIELAEMRQNFVPILEDGGVDLILCGHSHCYERSYFMDGNYGPSPTLNTNTMFINSGSGRETNGAGAYMKPEGGPIGHQGAVYVVAGSGSSAEGGSLNHNAMYVSLNLLGSMVIDITSNRLDALFLRDTGETNDCFSIVKGSYAGLTSNLVVQGNSSTNLLFQAGNTNKHGSWYVLTSAPTNGLITNFHPPTGLFTYTSVRGSTNGDSFQFSVTDGQTSSPPALVNISVQSLADTNHNGMDDSWERLYGVSDPNADPDQDGMSNLAEYIAGTDPMDANSWLRVTQVAGDSSGQVVLTWPGIGGVRYRVLYSNGDANGSFNGSFVPIIRRVQLEMAAGKVGSKSSMSFTDDFTLTGAPPSGKRYYRIQVVH